MGFFFQHRKIKQVPRLDALKLHAPTYNVALNGQGFGELASDFSPTMLNTEGARRGLLKQGEVSKKNQGEKRHLKWIEILGVDSGL